MRMRICDAMRACHPPTNKGQARAALFPCINTHGGLLSGTQAQKPSPSAATGQRACEWLLGCLRCVALQRTLTDGEESKMEAYAAGAKFDCLLFGEERTKINNPPQQPSCMDCCSCSFCLFTCACHSSEYLALHAQTWTTLCTR